MDPLAWLRARFGREDTPLAATPWVAVDCETSGLDLQADRLLSIGAVRLVEGRIAIGDAFHVVLRQAAESAAANIVIHGIGGDAQRAGMPAQEALSAFEAYTGGALLVGYHVHFDRTMIARAMQEAGRPPKSWRWLDLAELLPALFPERSRACKALDDWLAALEVLVDARHDALADAVATAQLFQVALAAAGRQGVTGARALMRLAADARWAGG